MEKKPCACCKDGRPSHGGRGIGYGYNRLGGAALTWAKDNHFTQSEHCVPVIGGKRFKGPRWLADKCGDGRMGFSTRRDEVRMEVGLDGQFKSKRITIVSKKSSRATAIRHARRVDGSRCGLVSTMAILNTQRNPTMVKAQKRLALMKQSREPVKQLARRKRELTLFKLRLEAAGSESRVVTTKVELEKKALRARNRNRRAARGHKRAMKTRMVV